MRHASIGYTKGLYQNINRIVENNILYMSNLVALSHWYYYVRALWNSDTLASALHKGLCETIHGALEERIKQFKKFCGNMPTSIRAFHSLSEKSSPIIDSKQKLYENCDHIIDTLRRALPPSSDSRRDMFIEPLSKMDVQSYLERIQSLNETNRMNGINWLQHIVDSTSENARNILRVAS